MPVTIAGALSSDGLGAMVPLECGTAGDVFVAHVDKVLVAELREGDQVVMDHLGAHEDVLGRPLIEDVGAKVV